ncbi:hypothetical protein ASC88_09525 [Rhizobacter sp. Root29]|nr:hypothetical protein ASC88_09525 [Rhizobacter sp. Root29]
MIVLLVVVFLIVWLARGGRPGRSAPPSPTPAKPAATPDTIVACAHCGLHLPQADALPGRGGVFCGEAHRAAFERAQPPQ